MRIHEFLSLYVAPCIDYIVKTPLVMKLKTAICQSQNNNFGFSSAKPPEAGGLPDSRSLAVTCEVFASQWIFHLGHNRRCLARQHLQSCGRLPGHTQ